MIWIVAILILLAVVVLSVGNTVTKLPWGESKIYSAKRVDRRFKVQANDSVDLWKKPSSTEVWVYQKGTEQGYGHMATITDSSLYRMMSLADGYTAVVKDIQTDFMHIRVRCSRRIPSSNDPTLPWNTNISIEAYIRDKQYEFTPEEWVKLYHKPHTSTVNVYSRYSVGGSELLASIKSPMLASRLDKCYEYNALVKRVDSDYIILDVIFYKNYVGSQQEQFDLVRSVKWEEEIKRQYKPRNVEHLLTVWTHVSIDPRGLILKYNEPSNFIYKHPLVQNFWLSDKDDRRIEAEIELTDSQWIKFLRAINSSYQLRLHYSSSRVERDYQDRKKMRAEFFLKITKD